MTRSSLRRGLMDARTFFSVLSRRTPRTAARIDRAIEARCLRTMAVLVSDASGFTRRLSAVRPVISISAIDASAPGKS